MAQTAADLTAAVELLPTSTTCSVEVTRPLDFAQVESPATAAQSGSLTIHPTATEAVAVRTFHHVIPHGEASAGAASVRGFGVTAFEVAVAPAFQASVLAGPAHALEFAGRWAQSTARARSLLRPFTGRPSPCLARAREGPAPIISASAAPSVAFHPTRPPRSTHTRSRSP